MARDLVYFDLETQRTANDAGGWDRKGNMQMSIGVTYMRALAVTKFFTNHVHDLIERLRRADLVVGFNVLNFDYHVLMGYTVLDLAHELPTADLMLDMETKLGHRLGLEAIAHATLGVRKTAASLDATAGGARRDLEIAEYCCFDVKVTRAPARARLPAQGASFMTALRGVSESRSTGRTSTPPNSSTSIGRQ